MKVEDIERSFNLSSDLNNGGPLSKPEDTKGDRKGKFLINFRDRSEEKMYRIYFTRQKCDLADSVAVFSVLFDIYVLVIESIKFSHLKLTKIIVFGVLILLSIIVLVCTQITKIAFLRAFLLTTLWLLLTCGVFLDLILNGEMTVASDGVSWTMVLVYVTYVTLPGRLVICVAAAAFATLCHVAIVVTMWYHRDVNVTLLGNQIGANLVLIVCAHLLGMLFYVHDDLQQRKSFVEARSSLSVKVNIEREFKQQKRLLLSVLPKHVANEMLRDWGENGDGQFRKIFLTRYENVSILFADIVGFTAISSSVTAAELVKTLNELFARFDKLANKFHQHRIKILGDCYYCVCGAPDPRPDHALLCIHMGLNVVDAITYVREKTKKDVNMRVGIHTGAVLGGVLGQRQWQYDVLGKEVILANKMESGGVPGRVHISETTESFLHGEFELEPGHGDQREDYIRLLGLKTFLVKSVLKPLKLEENSVETEQNGTTKSLAKGREDTSPVNEDETTYADNKNTIGFHDNEGIHGEQLQQALLERSSSTGMLGHLHPLSMQFVERELESHYQNRPEAFSGVAAIGLCLVALCTFLARLAVLPITAFSTASFFIGIIILVAMTTIVIAPSINSKCPNSMMRLSRWITKSMVPRFLWTALLVVVLAAADITDVFGCTEQTSFNSTSKNWLAPDDISCSYPPYLVHTGSLVLLGIVGLFQIGHLAKLILVVVVTTTYSLLYTIEMVWLFHHYDLALYSPFERDHLLVPLQYRLVGELVAVALALAFLARQMDYTSRKLFMWTEEAGKQREQVAALRIKNEALVYNLLPGHVATEFLGSHRTDEELYSHAYDEVSVIFAACPNFHDFYNESAVNNNGLECFRFLNEIISDYDELLEQERFASSVCKIKTVGPTYMAASGMTRTDAITKETSIKQRWGHLDDMVQFAFSMKETLQRINEQSFNNFVLRIGINHGPVIAGVIGARKPHYDIWGNTVNVASRMESTGHAGKIQVVEETMLILKHFGYTFQKRGLIKVKGKGELMTYFVEDKNH